jgi:hypothetical protein
VDVLQVAQSESCVREGKVPKVKRSPSRLLEEDVSEIGSFFGQLWVVPKPRLNRARQSHPNLFWIRRDLWESNNFEFQDCYPVRVGDVLKSELKRGSFIRGAGKQLEKSYLQALTGEMVGRIGRGRGRGRGDRFEEEQWGRVVRAGGIRASTPEPSIILSSRHLLVSSPISSLCHRGRCQGRCRGRCQVRFHCSSISRGRGLGINIMQGQGRIPTQVLDRGKLSRSRSRVGLQRKMLS